MEEPAKMGFVSVSVVMVESIVKTLLVSQNIVLYIKISSVCAD